MVGCTSRDFTIEGQIDGVPDKVITVAYIGDSGAVSQQITLSKGNMLKFTGISSDPTLVWLWDSQGQIVAQMVVKNGDRIIVASDGFQLPTLNVKGNDVTEQWMKFRKENQNLINSQEYVAVDKLIEKQITEHPDQLLSTVLLVAEYSQLDDTKKVSSLLQAINAEVRPQRLVSTLEYMIQHKAGQPTMLTGLTMFRQDAGVEELVTRGKCTVLLFWSRGDERLQACVDTMRNVSGYYGRRVVMADILVDTDTAQWYRSTHNTAMPWGHWWAPGGLMDPMLHGLNVERTPMMLVADSTAHVVYWGLSPTDASVTLAHLLPAE